MNNRIIVNLFAAIALVSLFYLLIMHYKLQLKPGFALLNYKIIYSSATARTIESAHNVSSAATFPLILHQTYKSSKVPQDYAAFISKCTLLNSNWEYWLWRDADINQLIKKRFPYVAATFKLKLHNVQIADLARLMILYEFGGIYIDMDVECVQPFSKLFANHNHTLTAFIDQERPEHSRILYNKNYSAMNSAMGGIARHPFFQLAINMSLKRLPSNDVLGSTGPGLLLDVYDYWVRNASLMQQYPINMLDSVEFSPLVDTALHNFRVICKRKTDKELVKAGCKSMKANNWRNDYSDPNATIAKHTFMHLGYSWGRKVKRFVEVKSVVSRVKNPLVI